MNLNTTVKDVIDDFSPTRNRKVAMKKIQVAGELIADNGTNMPAESLIALEAGYNDLVGYQPSVTTGWRDVITHPVKTYTNTRKFKKGAGKLLYGAIIASCEGDLRQYVDAVQQAENTVQQVHGEQTDRASDGHTVNVPAAVGPAVATFSTSPSAHLDSEAGSPIAHLPFGDSEIRLGSNTRATLEFDADVDPPARIVRQTASIFTATDTARIVSKPPHTSSDEPSQDDGDDSLSVCILECLDGPVLTALTENEGTTDSGPGTD